VVDEALKSRPRAEVFDTVLVPALGHAERDLAEGQLDETDLAFVRRVVTEIVEDLEGAPEITLATVSQTAEAAPGPGPADAPATSGEAAARLTEAGASHVAPGLADARAYLVSKLAPSPAPAGSELHLVGVGP